MGPMVAGMDEINPFSLKDAADFSETANHLL